MQTIRTKDVVHAKAAIPAIEDHGRVQMGAMTPGFPPVRATPANVKDRGKIEMGAMSPSFSPVR
jgi:hypothetical protein